MFSHLWKQPNKLQMSECSFKVFIFPTSLGNRCFSADNVTLVTGKMRQMCSETVDSASLACVTTGMPAIETYKDKTTGAEQQQQQSRAVAPVFEGQKHKGHWRLLCVRNCRPTGGHGDLSLREKEHFGLSLRVEVGGVCGGGVGMSLCTWRVLILSWFSWHAHTQKWVWLTLCWSSHAFWCNDAPDEWTQPGTFQFMDVCLFLCVCVFSGELLKGKCLLFAYISRSSWCH